MVEQQVSTIHAPGVKRGENHVFSLTGLNGSIAVDGRTVTVKPESTGGRAGRPVVLTADSIEGAVVWTGVSESRFSLQYSTGPGRGSDPRPAEFLWIRFTASDKEWWDAMASAVMKLARRSRHAGDDAATSGKAPADAVSAAPPSFDGWLTRTLGLDA